MNHTQTIDSAKHIFFLHGENAVGKVALRQKLTRDQLMPLLANQPLSMVALEAGCVAYHWARAFSKQIEPRMLDIMEDAARQL